MRLRLLTSAFFALVLLVRQIRNNCHHNHRHHQCLPSYDHSYLVPFFIQLVIIASITKDCGALRYTQYCNIIRLLYRWNEMSRQSLIMITLIIIIIPATSTIFSTFTIYSTRRGMRLVSWQWLGTTMELWQFH